MRWYVQDEVNQDYSEQNEVDGMKKGADSTGKVMNMWKSDTSASTGLSHYIVNSVTLRVTLHYVRHNNDVITDVKTFWRPFWRKEEEPKNCSYFKVTHTYT